MKKVVLLFDGGQYTKGTLELCQRMNDTASILLVGCFLPGIDFTGMSEIYGYGALDIPVQIRADEEVVEENIEQFKSYCVAHQISCRVHKDFTLDAYPLLHKESRYTDLLVIGSQAFLGQLALNIPPENLRDALHTSECPVMVVPAHYYDPEHIILAYDGSASSVYAIKMFSYIFPELCNKTTILLHVGGDGELPATTSIQQLGRAHFPNFQVLELETMDLFEDWIKTIPAPILVTGAFGRSGLSSLFRMSFSRKALSSFSFPVFIAHL